MKENEKKVFLVDTNVILHDHRCIFSFADNDVVISMPVIEEVDKFKKGNDEKAFQARRFSLELDKLKLQKSEGNLEENKKSHSSIHNGGASLGKNRGKLQVKTCGKFEPDVKQEFPEDIPDHRILNIAYRMLMDPKETRKVVLVSKDTNLRLKADGLGIEAEDYKNDKISNLSDLYTGWALIENYGTKQAIDEIYAKKVIPIDRLKEVFKKGTIYPNMYFILKSKDKKGSALVRVDKTMENLHLIVKKSVSNIEPRNAEQFFSIDTLLNPDVYLTTLNGKAGTGKTLLAIACGIHLVKEGVYKKIIIASANTPLANKDIGFLPGSANEKVSPYLAGIYDNIDLLDGLSKKMQKKQPVKREKPRKKTDHSEVPFIEKSEIQQMLAEGRIQIQPLAFIRGRSLPDVYFIVDEAQNLTPHEVKAIVTRAGEKTRVTFCGDIEQIDNPYIDSTSNGLVHLGEKFKGKSIASHVTLVKSERSELAEMAAELL